MMLVSQFQIWISQIENYRKSNTHTTLTNETNEECLIMRIQASRLFPLFLLIPILLSCSNKEQQAQKHYKKGFEFHNQGSLDQAIEEYQKALKLNPSYAEVYMNLGAIYVEKKDYDAALLQFKKVVELNHFNAKAHYNLGMVYVYTRQKEKAEDELKILKSFGSGLADNLQMKIVDNFEQN